MKDAFRGFYALDEREFETLWNRAIFIFDTNVLLNLYRYQSTTRDALLTVIESLGNRVWVPYHVGMEYQRNRLDVIGEQQRRYHEVESIVGKAIADVENEFDRLQLKNRHSYIDPDKVLESLQNVHASFSAELKKLSVDSLTVNSEDSIRDRLDTIFSENIGDRPLDQNELDDLYSEGSSRYEQGIPPGYKDSEKGRKGDDEFSYSGIVYKRKYGDLIIWKQIIAYAAEQKIEDIVFVTDDNKSDWWWKVESSGPKTIGPRPELIDEIGRLASVKRFYMYTTDGFLKRANEMLGTHVTSEAIEEVRELSVEKRVVQMKHQEFREKRYAVEKIVYHWLQQHFPEIQSNRGFPEFVGTQDDRKYGFDVKYMRNPISMLHRLRKLLYRAYYKINEEEFYEIGLIFVLDDIEHLSEIENRIRRIATESMGNIRIILGVVYDFSGDGKLEFERYLDFSPGMEMPSKRFNEGNNRHKF